MKKRILVPYIAATLAMAASISVAARDGAVVARSYMNYNDQKPSVAAEYRYQTIGISWTNTYKIVTAASGKTHGADQRVKQQICFSASCCCDRKNRGTHRCEARYSSGAARACGPAAPMNCVNPPLAGSRSSSAVILLPRFLPPQI